MSRSNEAFEYFGSRLSVEKANFDVVDKVEFVSNALSLNVCTDLRRSDLGINNHNHVSPEEEKEVSERLSFSTRAAHLHTTDSLTLDDSASNAMVTTRNRQKSADLVRRYCSKCELTVAVVSVSSPQLCAKCGTLLDFQCTRCDKLYSYYASLIYHLESICNRQNLVLKCPKCDYQTQVKTLMSSHLRHCTRELFHSCNRCEYKTKKRSDLLRHMRNVHKDYAMKIHENFVAIGDTSEIADEKKKDILITTGERQKPAYLIRRYCSKCEITDTYAGVTTKKFCANCGTLLEFQCIRCNKLYSSYKRFLYHLDSICDRQNLDLKCPKCDYQTHVKKLLTEHLKYCTSEINHRCSHCEFKTKQRSNLFSHIRRMHKDIYYATCSKCRGKPNKCHQCKNTELIWENFHVDFSSNDRHLEHYESCEK